MILGAEKMKKLTMLLSLSALMAFALFAVTIPAHATISSYNWVDTLLKNETDSFLGYVDAGYQAGSTAILKINVYNRLTAKMNISVVYVSFDWGINYSSTEANLTQTLIYRLSHGMSHVFTITFTVPNTTIASNLMTHSYVIYVEDVNVVGTKLNSNPPSYGSNFAVLSGNQASCIKTKREISKYADYGMFMTAEAKRLSLMARGAKTLAEDAYQKGNFGDAATNYQDSLSLYQDALGNETSIISGFETSLKGMMDFSSGAINMMGLGYVIFGLGWVFIGIGVIIYSMRKPKSTSPSQ